MDDPLRQAENRLQRYWNVDGLHELGIAVLLALTALWVWASDLSELPHVWKGVFSATFPVLLCGGIAVEGPIVKAIRRRLTYPRAGFAEFRKPPRRNRVWAATMGIMIAAVIASSAFVELALLRWTVALIGLGMAGLLWQIGCRANLIRFRAVAALVLVSGIAVTVAGFPFEMGIVVYFALVAAAFLVSGGITLWRFLRT
jgi:hypothetical protein